MPIFSDNTLPCMICMQNDQKITIKWRFYLLAISVFLNLEYILVGWTDDISRQPHEGLVTAFKWTPAPSAFVIEVFRKHC